MVVRMLNVKYTDQLTVSSMSSAVWKAILLKSPANGSPMLGVDPKP